MQLVAPTARRRPGYSIVELIFAIAFLTSISAICLAGFVNIFGLFNKAQSVARTQEEARNAIDVIMRDLRNTTSIDGLDMATPGFVTVTPAADLAAVPPAAVIASGTFSRTSPSKDVFCLHQATTGKSVGYVLMRTGTGTATAFRLFRTDGCWDFTRATQLVSQDVWSDTGSTPGVNAQPLPADRRPLRIDKITGGTDGSPVVWQVKLAVHRGNRVPGVTIDGNDDRFSAETVLQGTVNTRE